jgi:hypothetical protein
MTPRLPLLPDRRAEGEPERGAENHIVKRRVLRGAARILAGSPMRALVSSRDVFDIWQRRGYSIVPNNFYGPVPDLTALDSSVWRSGTSLGLDFGVARQLELLEKFRLYIPNFDQLDRTNDFFGSVDAEVLYSMVRLFTPSTIIEVGSGYSTRVMLKALEKTPAELITIEPYQPERMPIPPTWTVPVQKVPLAEFERLKRNDILFIDSSHVLKLGSDVWFELLEIVPRLASGVIVHFHDIFLPDEYPSHWTLKHHRFWNEQYALQAFLAFNHEFSVLWGSSYMATRHRTALEDVFGPLGEGAPASFWIQRR